MLASAKRLACVLGISLTLSCCLATGPYKWFGRDAFDVVMDKMGEINEQNCRAMSVESLRLPEDSLGQIPRFNVLPQIIIFPNRTQLIHMHNTALNRGYFYSYILQRLNTSESIDFPLLPGMLYYYLSAAADVSSSIGLMNGSGVLFDTHSQYANWYPTLLLFNNTLPLFGPKAFLLDDYADPVNWLREPTNNTIKVEDLGSGIDRNYTANWHRLYPMVINDRDRGISFIPDRGNNYQEKHQYDFTIYSAQRVGVMNPIATTKRKFFGPPSPGTSESYQPVYFSRPYFDCGRSNKWIVSSVAPVIDFMPRYSDQVNLRKPKYVATTVTEMDFLKIDFDPCGRTGESEDHTFFSGVARCRSTTLCEPLPGFGFQRGGYMCHCLPGYRYPYWQNGPFMGTDIEQASESEAAKFECLPVDWKMQRLTGSGITPSGQVTRVRRLRKKRSLNELKELLSLMQVYNATSMGELTLKVHQHHASDRSAASRAATVNAVRAGVNNAAANAAVAMQYLAKMLGWQQTQQHQLLHRGRRSLATDADYGDSNIFYLGRLASFDPQRYNTATELINHKLSITAANCAANPVERLQLPGEAAYRASEVFEVQGRAALRLAHFLSAFSQNADPDEMYGALKGDNYLNREQLYGEVFANVMSDQWIRSSGVYFDREAFWDPLNRTKMEYFGPTAFKTSTGLQTDGKQRELSFVADDAAGWPKWREYHQQEWFRVLKERWASNTYGLERFVVNPNVRTDINGTGSQPFQRYPMFFRAARFSDMFWSQPYFDCNRDRSPDARHTNAWVITAAAPFFGRSELDTLQFLGVVTVTVPLEKLDINQCPASFYQANAFKNTAPCHYESTYCVPVIRNQFGLGNFKCECRQGHEYPYNDFSIWFYAGGTVSDHYEKNLRNEKNYYRLLQCREASGMLLLGNWAAVTAAAAAAAGLQLFSRI